MSIKPPAAGRINNYDRYVPCVRGIFDAQGRLKVLVNSNTELGGAWEWADSPAYPLRLSNQCVRALYQLCRRCDELLSGVDRV
jgi:hypothetical protein